MRARLRHRVGQGAVASSERYGPYLAPFSGTSQGKDPAAADCGAARTFAVLYRFAGSNAVWRGSGERSRTSSRRRRSAWSLTRARQSQPSSAERERLFLFLPSSRSSSFMVVRWPRAGLSRRVLVSFPVHRWRSRRTRLGASPLRYWPGTSGRLASTAAENRAGVSFRGARIEREPPSGFAGGGDGPHEA
jgi:hypothetical protein